MNIEGTKHEKAMLVLIAYIIGFTSGFIAFGVSSLGDAPVATDMSSELSAWPEGYTPPTTQPPESMTEAPAEVVYYEDGKLYATVGADKFVLSLHSEIMPTENVEGFSTQGIHEGLPMYSVSPDGRYIYFCEQQTTDLECTNFVFDVAGSIIHPVSNNGERLITANEVAETARWEGDNLVIGDYTSLTIDSPWKVAMAE